MKKRIFAYLYIPDEFLGQPFPFLIQKINSSKFIRNVIETFGTRILLIIIGMITSVVVTRILGPELRGVYATAGVISAIGAQFCNLGLHSSNTYAVAKDRSLLPMLLGNSLLVSFGLGAIVAILVWFIFRFAPVLAPIHGMILVFSLISIPLGIAYMLLQNLLLGIQKIRVINVVEVTIKILALIFICTIIVWKNVTVEKILIAGLITSIIGVIWVLKELSTFINKKISLSIKVFKENIKYGLKAYFAALFAFLTLKMSLLMVQYMLGAEQTGFYSAALSIADMIFILPVVIGTILFPKLSEMQDKIKKWEYTKRIALLVGVMMLILTGIPAIFAKYIIKILYGSEFLPAVPAFMYLMPGILLLSINTIFMNYFASIGMPPVTIYSPFIALILNFILNIKLIPLYKIVGASISSVIVYGCMLAFSLIYIFRINKNDCI